VSVFLLLELWVFPYLARNVLGNIALLSLVLGLCMSSIVAAWGFVRFFRLFCKRSFYFMAGLLVWVFAYVGAVVAQFCPSTVLLLGIKVSWIVVFLLACMLMTGIVRLGGFGFAHELGWPLLKPVHLLYSTIVITLYVVGILDHAQVFLYASVGLFLVSRYAYNRWIYATRVLYPYKPTAAKFYIKQMR
jgi:hypothetical protein